ncbi:MAG TPA: methylated-DNA--[protein]-cysteine S-methyltransferase [Nitrospirota bacterium]|nr:methylated-DNA--[protein]-cysteine S-methyltransferase [Nitrospirota bacterium]
MSAEYTLFKTPLGVCGVAWRRRNPELRVTALQLPEATPRLTESRIVRTTSAAKARIVPAQIRTLIKRVNLHFKGEAQDFQDVAVDMESAGPFMKKVYQAARRVPAGATVTYGELAAAAGRPGASRAVGQAMGRNPVPLIIPCHRVLAAGNRPGGFSAHGGIATKAKMLELEGVLIEAPPVIRSMRDMKRAASLLAAKDARLRPVLSRPIEFRVRPEHSPYEVLVEAVVHQQLSPKAAAAILDRVAALYAGSRIPAPSDMVKTPDRRLRGAGLSRSKTKAVKDIAAKTVDGLVPPMHEMRSLSNETIIKRLASIYGVGRWTVEMMLIFNLGRMDVLPVDDFALRKSVARVYGMKAIPTPRQVSEIGEAWKPYRTVASLYLWNAME